MSEIADVYIMLTQLRMVVGVTDEDVENHVAFKLGRLAGRMDAERDFETVDDL